MDIQNQEKTQGQQQTERVVQPHPAGAVVSAQKGKGKLAIVRSPMGTERFI